MSEEKPKPLDYQLTFSILLNTSWVTLLIPKDKGCHNFSRWEMMPFDNVKLFDIKLEVFGLGTLKVLEK